MSLSQAVNAALGGWTRRPDTFKLRLVYAIRRDNDGGSSPTAQAKAQFEIEWQPYESVSTVMLRLAAKRSTILPALLASERRVVVQLQTQQDGSVVVVAEMEPLTADLVDVSLQRAAGATRTVSLWDEPGTLSSMFEDTALETVRRVVLAEGVARFWSDRAMVWQSLKSLNLASCNLAVLPVEVGSLPALQTLVLENNKLTALPAELGQLSNLENLSVDHNLLATVPNELRHCARLKMLSFEDNKLVTPLLDLRAMTNLHTLRLVMNPLEYVPEIVPCLQLRHFTLANVRISGDAAMNQVSVTLDDAATAAAGLTSSIFTYTKAQKWSLFFSMIFRSSCCQHPLVATAITMVAEDRASCAAIVAQPGAVQRLVSMALSDNLHVVNQACTTLTHLAQDPTLARRLVDDGALSLAQSLIKSENERTQVNALRVISSLSVASDDMSGMLLTEGVMQRLQKLCTVDCLGVRRHALTALGNFAFSNESRQTILEQQGLKRVLVELATADSPEEESGLKLQSVEPDVQMQTPAEEKIGVIAAARRALAILGENDALCQAVRPRRMPTRGVRVLSLDGGGMRGMATVQMLRRLEEGTGRRIFEMFDLICGTSTGGIMATAIGVRRMTLDECEDLYKQLGKEVFKEQVNKEEATHTVSWRERLDSLYKSGTQGFRVVVHGSKHNAAHFEELVQNICSDYHIGRLIDTAILDGPKVCVVSTIVSVTPAHPFVFRNYQHPPGAPSSRPWDALQIVAGSTGSNAATGQKDNVPDDSRPYAYMGSCKHLVWQAIRASSAAPYYLDDFALDNNRWQDGAITANNPAVVAIKEARTLWPDLPIECLVSVGSGVAPPKIRGKSWRYIDTGQVLVESACSTHRTEEALETLLPLLPNLSYYRFNPVDDRQVMVCSLGISVCEMEMDDTDPRSWERLQQATKEYIERLDSKFSAACVQLVEPFHSSAVKGNNVLTLGSRRGMLLLTAPHVLMPENDELAAQLQTFCQRHAVPWQQVALPQTVAASRRASRENSVSQSPSTPRSAAAHGSASLGTPDGPTSVLPAATLSPLRLGDASLNASASTQKGSRQADNTLAVMNDLLQARGADSGLLHVHAHGTSAGLVLSWRTDMVAIPEPSEAATTFLAAAADETPFTTMAELCDTAPAITISGILHVYAGRHTQVLENGEEIGAFLFRRALPAVTLDVNAVHMLTGIWRNRIITADGFVPSPLVEALVACGAKAVIARTHAQPPKDSTSVSQVVHAAAGASELTPSPGKDVVQFFTALNKALFVYDEDVQTAFAAAMDAVPGCKQYRCRVNVDLKQ
eukprot:jgi/Chlat1/2634/Chrsp178S02477